ncbi:conserved Plasmodium protein, unknown function [Plasmodium gallinaceum]|uniref:Uncharacterized protein n=1 Tax=Plasmodium gallinaceum TaxID=5849 RepID=A0A1J1GVK6_PLAGA|nr:conserved Plasmodium protein, unknown function [Plasmodium gallinaceum]CRG96348.1 conserved Plasmodium protein, unknown function [Plasmodium gallinaceum]
MHNYDSMLQNEAFSIEEIYESDITNEENKLLIEYIKNMQNERNLIPNTVNANIILDKNENLNRNKIHKIFEIIDKYTESEELEKREYNKNSNLKWKTTVIEYLTNLRNYIHKKYNRKIIDAYKYNSSDCSILLSLQKNENLISIFRSKPLCVHLYIYGINYKQIIYYIDIVTQYIESEKENNLFLYLWLIYFLILLDSLQALDSNVSSNLQIIKRFCIKKIGNSNICAFNKKKNNIDFLTHFNCKSKVINCDVSLHCMTNIFYIIYYIITDIFNQK